jgi:ribosomal protein L20
MYALERNEYKFSKRDKRIFKKQPYFRNSTQMLKIAEQSVIEINKKVYESRKKDYESDFRRITYRNDEK